MSRRYRYRWDMHYPQERRRLLLMERCSARSRRHLVVRWREAIGI